MIVNKEFGSPAFRRIALPTLGVLLLSSCGGERAAVEHGPPNIVVVLADDLGYSDLGAYGGEIATPAIDRLAADGRLFSWFLTQGRCVPSRATLLTGRHPHEVGLAHMTTDLGPPAYRGSLAEDVPTLPELLRERGYRNYMAGKWHLTPYDRSPDEEQAIRLGEVEPSSAALPYNPNDLPTARGFDRFYGTIPGFSDYWNPHGLFEDDRPVAPEGAGDGRYFYTDAITERALAFLDQHVEERPNAPFFLYAAYTTPHWPLHAREEDLVEEDRAAYREGPAALKRQRHERQRQLELPVARHPLPPDDPALAEADWNTRGMQVYAAQVRDLDEAVGRLVDWLAARGLLENTLLLVLSDNGTSLSHVTDRWREIGLTPGRTADGRPVVVGNQADVLPGPADTFQSYGRAWAHATNTPFRLFKTYVHEGGLAAPLIAHWPARLEGSSDDRPRSMLDLLPTLLVVAGGEPGGRYEGLDLFASTDEALARVDARRLAWEHQGNRALLGGGYKLVSLHDGSESSRWELYRTDSDRTETRDLAAEEPETVEAMAAEWQAWADRVGIVPWTQLEAAARTAR
ncbi:MAG: sulfatase-like hydrolase/transferase [Holophagales bacterium]|nr:sulfatase-like hydrolase/transferase [Holophagales bacterium]MYD23762.1 sulfatase-like hydrolase/transferase [Holophagales bacterium]MYI34739.1 sulfatase-like hydrolase/transferase [Holophagales bacterium]